LALIKAERKKLLMSIESLDGEEFESAQNTDEVS
jgi:hypothetical protein